MNPPKKQNYFSLLITSVLADTANDNDDQSEIYSQELSDTTTYTSAKESLQPPIFIKGVLNFSDTLSALTNLIDPNSFVFNYVN